MTHSRLAYAIWNHSATVASGVTARITHLPVSGCDMNNQEGVSMGDFFNSLRNLSAYLHDLQFHRFLCSACSPRYAKVYMDGLGWFEGTPEQVIDSLVSAAKAKTGAA